jgi:hypothetical protein
VSLSNVLKAVILSVRIKLALECLQYCIHARSFDVLGENSIKDLLVTVRFSLLMGNEIICLCVNVSFQSSVAVDDVLEDLVTCLIQIMDVVFFDRN